MNLIGKASLHIGGVISYNCFLFIISFNVSDHITQIVSCNSAHGMEMFYSQNCFSLEVLKDLCRKFKSATLQKCYQRNGVISIGLLFFGPKVLFYHIVSRDSL